MDFKLSPDIDEIRLRIRGFVDRHVLPLESDPDAYDDHENIAEAALASVCNNL